MIEVNSTPAIRQHLTPKYHADHAISYRLDELSLLRLEPDEQSKLAEQDSIVPNSSLTSPKTLIGIPTKPYVESLHEINRNRRDLLSI